MLEVLLSESCNHLNQLAKACGKDVFLRSHALAVEFAMPVRLTMIAAVAALGTAASAEPQKAAAQTPSQPAKIVLASADPVRSPGPGVAKPMAAAAKRPAGRVTTCRCGGNPPPASDSQDR
jgi:hypothetical protein